jgi:hypothetical protein
MQSVDDLTPLILIVSVLSAAVIWLNIAAARFRRSLGQEERDRKVDEYSWW